MTAKIIIETTDAAGIIEHECRVIAAENGHHLEKRIETILSNLKADGYKYVRLRDCFNLELPDIFQRN